ncbi:hypothetical protein CKY51_19655 [Xanthomonas maliensis]|nr:hypothetical protein CKY51_19655 [Xanthomonas maliensis]
MTPHAYRASLHAPRYRPQPRSTARADDGRSTRDRLCRLRAIVIDSAERDLHAQLQCTAMG